jgi:filamentous hemagglutinin
MALQIRHLVRCSVRTWHSKQVFLRSLSNVWGSSLDDLKASYEMDGWTVTDKAPRANSSGNAQIFTVDAPSDGSVVVKQVQYSPESDVSVHGGQYYKFSYTDGSTVKVINPDTYRVTGWPENNTTFYNQAGNQIVYDPVTKTWSHL